MGKRIYLASIWGITLICVGIGCMRYTFSSPWSFWGEGNYDYVEDFDTSIKRKAEDHGEKGTHQYEQSFTNLILDCDTADITIKTGSDFSCKYKVSSGTEYSFDWKPDNEGTAYITQKNSKAKNNKGCSFIITIPSHVTLSSLSIKNAVGDTEINGITVDTVSVITDVGDFDMENVNAGNVIVDADTGDVELEHVIFANLTVSCDVGDCSVEGVNVDDYNVELSADVGEVEVNDEHYRSSYTQDNGRSQKVDITCSVGDVEIN